MSTFSEYLKNKRKIRMLSFLGEGNYRTVNNQAIIIKSVINKDNIILRTDRVLSIKEDEYNIRYIFVVGKKQFLYLKPWQFRKVKAFSYEARKYVPCYIVKLARGNYKPYYSKEAFRDFVFNKTDTFDDLFELAKIQDNEKIQIKF